MGQLFLVNDSFELLEIPVQSRDKLLINFCRALNLAITNRDSLWGTEDIHTREYSFGKLFYGFLLKSISEINEVESLKGISNTALSLFHSLAYSVPGLINSLETKDKFEIDFNGLHLGNCGIDYAQKQLPYVGCEKSWHQWKIDWFSLNQREIYWSNKIDEYSFLPNKSFSDAILIREIKLEERKREIKKGYFTELDKKKYAVTFHDKVMRKKGQDLSAYTISIGGEIARANYYIYDSALSKNESESASSLRTIYKIIGKDGNLKYISLDHKHGMFEFHNHKGEHLGEFKFDGSYNSDPETSHNLKTL